MKKLTILIVLCLFASITFATETRIRGLGYIEDFMDDDVNILNFPGTLSDYRNLSILEMDYRYNDGSLTANYYNKNLDFDFSLLLEKELNLTQSILDVDYSTLGPERITSFMFGNDHTVLYFGAAGKSNDDDVVDDYSYRSESSGFHFRTGIGRSFRGSFPSDLALHFQFSDEKYNSYSTADIESNLKGYDTRLLFRFKRTFKNGVIRPYFKLGYQYYNIDSRNTSQTTYSNRDIFVGYFDAVFGVAYEKKITGKSTLWIGLVPVNYRYSENNTDRRYDNNVNDPTPAYNYEEDTLTRYNYPYLFFSLESQITDWLTWRTGIKSIYQYSLIDEYEDNTGGAQYSRHYKKFYSHYYVYYGLSAYYKKFTIDATVSPDLLYNGPQFITGQGSPFIGYLSLSYKW